MDNNADSSFYISPQSAHPPGSSSSKPPPAIDRILSSSTNINSSSPQFAELTVNSNFALFEEDGTNRRPVSSLLQSQQVTQDHSAQRFLSNDKEALDPPPNSTLLNTVIGVFIPSLQCMTGILFFVRLPFIVGMSGIGYTLSFLSIAVVCTTLTSASISAVISNGINSGGGPYYLISRTLGREVGGSIGILYFLSLLSSVSLTVLGAVEVLRKHILPTNLQFKDVRNTDRLTGFLALTILLLATSVSSKLKNHLVAAIGLVTFISLFFILVGLVTASYRVPDLSIVKPTLSLLDTLYPINDETFMPSMGNWVNQFVLFFPLVTGIMAGANKSNLVKNVHEAFPKGTLSAITVSAAAYLTTILLLAATIQRPALRSSEQLPILAIVAWPHPAIGYISILTAALGAAAQSSLGAHGLLRAFARDNLLGMDRVMAWSMQWIPLLITFVLTMALVLVGELDRIAPITTQCFLLTYAGLNAATTLGAFTKAPGWRPTYKMYHWTFSLLGTVLCMTLMVLISWWASLIAVSVGVVIFKLIELDRAQGSWGADGLWSLTIEVAQRNLFKLESLPYQAGLWRPQVLAMLPLTADVNNTPIEKLHCAMAALVGQLKKGGGLSILCLCINADLETALNQQLVAKSTTKLEQLVNDLHLEAFVQVIVARSYLDALIAGTQAAGIGFLRPNTIIQFFPDRHLPASDSSLNNIQPNDTLSNTWTPSSAFEFVESIRSVILLNKALLLVRGLHSWPINDAQQNTIDVYWIVHDGGILRMLPWLLQRHSVWRRCKLRVFAVAQLYDNSIEMQRNLEQSLRESRIQAETTILELGDQDVSEFVHEMTVRMESREKFMQKLEKSASPAIRRRTQTQGLLVQQLKSFHRNASAPIQRLLSNKQRPDFINTSVRLNSLMLEHSSSACMVLCNLPAPTSGQPPLDYIEYLETLCRGLPRIILTKGNGLELA